jgi:hypothetical protein
MLDGGSPARRRWRVLAAWWAAAALAAALLWPWFEACVAQSLRWSCSLLLSPLSFGAGGHVDFVSAAAHTGLERAASWDLRMLLRIDEVAQTHALALNPRRLLALPIASYLLCVGAAPATWAQKRRALALGLPLLWLLALLSVWLVAVYLFAQVEGLVYSLTPGQAAVLRVLYEGWVTPLANKFIVPLVLAALLLARPGRPRPQDPQPATATRRDPAGSAPRARASSAASIPPPAHRGPRPGSGRRRKARPAGRRS